MTKPIIRLAVQRAGRLSDDSVALLQECGLGLSNNRGINKLKSEAANFPIEILYLRDDDIPGYVADGVADVGIVGENVMVEANKEVSLVERLGFSKCRLSLAVSRDSKVQNVKDLAGSNIATSYPRLLSQFLEKHQVKAKIHEISGSVEIAPSIGLAEAICDIVGSGSTLISNGLREIERVFDSEAVLIASPNLSLEKRETLEKLLFRVQAVRRAKRSKYVVLNAPTESIDAIISILPGIKSPTVVSLATEGWSSVHSVVDEDEFWERIENLKAAGAQGILVIPIEKMIV